MARDRFSFTFDPAEQAREAARPDADTPFHILVAGNFSGGAGRGTKVVQVDRDCLDQVLAAIAPAVEVPICGIPLTIQFRELDDFHPDRLFERLKPFEQLRSLRHRLSNPATFAAAAAEMDPRGGNATAGPAPELRDLSGADVLSLMMGEAPTAKTQTAGRSDWEQMIHEMVAQYSVPSPDPRQPELIAQVDAAITGHMRATLHHPAFQSLEANWRALDFLVRRLDTGVDLKVFILDLPQEALATEPGIAALRRALTGDARALVAGLYYFSPGEETVLMRFAALARSAGAPLIAGLAPDVVGLTGAFAELRRSPDARWLGLALPRFLLRLPYGRESSQTETFEFEEMPEPVRHERYLWGHPAAACAYLLGEAFSRHGWEMRAGMVDTVEGLPLHVYREDGDSRVKPCAEVLLTEEAATLLLERGFIPLLSMKDSDRVRILRFQSVAEPLARLAGRWGSH